MFDLSQHSGKRSVRHVRAVLLLVIYLTISLSPLASLAMHSKYVAHAVKGECAGDCDICGCSAENRSNRTCCCAKKKQMHVAEHEDEDTDTPDCCKKKPAPKMAVISKCGCPCGTGKHAAIASGASYESIPSSFRETLAISPVETCYTVHPHQLISRHIEPPDPPPQNSSIS